MGASYFIVRAVAIGLLSSAVAAQTSSDWPTFGGQPGGGQYSALEQINVDNVDQLEVAWVHRSGDEAWLEVTPIHANNMLYYCTPMNRVIALDPVTGEEKWRFDPHADEGGLGLIEELRQIVRCRSVAYWEAETPRPGAACERRVYKGDINGYLFAIDADTGASCSDFGAGSASPTVGLARRRTSASIERSPIP